MTNITRQLQERGPIADPPTANRKDPTGPLTSTTCHVKNATLKQFTRLQALEPARQGNLPFTMERYLDDPPYAGGPTYASDPTHGSRHQNILNVVRFVNAEFGEEKTHT